MATIRITGGESAESFSQFIPFVVTLSEAELDVVTVSYITLRGTALNPDLDATVASTQHNGTVTFAPGETTKTIFIEADSDSIDEVDESVTVQLSNPVNASFPDGDAVLRATGVILDNDGFGSNLALFVSSPVVVEDDDGERSALFDVRLSRALAEDIEVDFQTFDVSATAGEDYVATSGTLTFEAGRESATVRVPILGDAIGEPTEMFALSVFPPESPIISSNGATGTATILDTDTSSLPEISVVGDVTNESFSSFARVLVSLSEPSLDAVTVNYRTLRDTAVDNDLDASTTSGQHNGTVTFAPGQTTSWIFIEAESDSIDEPDQNVTVEFYDPSGGTFYEGAATTRANVTILDNDGLGSNLAVFVSDPTIVEGDDGNRTALFDVEMSRKQGVPVTMTFETKDISATAGEDYIAQSGELVFQAGQTHQVVSVPIVGDTILEGAELFALTVTPPDGRVVAQQDATGIGTILDTDGSRSDGPQISMTGDYTEESFSHFMRFVVTLSEASADSVTIPYRTLRGNAEDFDLDASTTSTQHNTTLVFAPGETTKSIYIEADSDSVDEIDENITVELFDPVGAGFAPGVVTLRSTGIVLDNDGAGLNLAVFVSDPVVQEGDDGTRLATFDIELSRAQAQEVSLEFTTIDISALAGQDYEAAEGVLIFAPGQTRTQVQVPIIGDAIGEAAEHFGLSVAATGRTPAAFGEALILDTDTSPLPEISVEGDYSPESFSQFIRFVVSLSEESSTPITVNYATLAGSAELADLDSGLPSGTLTFAPGETSKSVFVEAESDSLDERDETVHLRLTEPENAVLPDGQRALFATGFIYDNDGVGPNRTVSAAPAALEETGETFADYEIEVTLSRPSTERMEFNAALIDGSAIAGEDIRILDDTVVFEPGQITASVTVRVLGDGATEAEEAVELQLSPTDDTPFVGIIQTTEISITDGPPIPTTGNDSIDGTGRDDDLDLLAGNDTVRAGGGDDSLFGGSGNDSMFGEAGDDTLEGGIGDDTLSGGDGTDTAVFSDALDAVVLSLSGSDLVISSSEGVDVVRDDIEVLTFGGADESFASLAASVITVVEGSNGGDVPLSGTSEDELIQGLAGNDLIRPGGGQDTVEGGLGSDTLDFSTLVVPSDLPAGALAIDASLLNGQAALPSGGPTVQFSSIENLIGSFGNDRLIGDNRANSLLGGNGDDVLVGNGGTDRLDGGSGVDTMTGGDGGDTYVLRDAGDVIFEVAGDTGVDRVISEVDVDLGDAHIEVVVLARDLTIDAIGSGDANFISASLGNNLLRGEGGNDRIEGRGGDDTLFGGEGADTLNGGPGSDVIHVEDASDRVAESRRWDGVDTVIAQVDFRMGTAHIENLELTGSAILGAGNGLMNVITGNDGDNILDGGKNVDTLIGGLGDDTYLVRAPGDNVIELAGQGIDTIRAFRAYVMDANVENLLLQTLRNDAGEGVAGVNGIGNDLDNLIVGNPFDNIIAGREGSDTLRGQAGADVFLFDRAVGADNVDTIVDFNTNTMLEGDVLRLDDAIFTGLTRGTLAAEAFQLGAEADDAADRMIFDAAEGRLYYDADGIGGADQALIAILERGASLAASDIEIV